MSKHILVDKDIAETEECIRFLFHPLMFSHKKIRPNSFLPPFGKNDVSLARLHYCDSLADCMSHACDVNIAENTFQAIASITVRIVELANQWANSDMSLSESQDGSTCRNGIRAHIAYAPMNNGKYVDRTVDVYADDPDISFSMHADLVYDCDNDSEVKTKLRAFVNQIIKKVKYSGTDALDEPWKQQGVFNSINVDV